MITNTKILTVYEIQSGSRKYIPLLIWSPSRIYKKEMKNMNEMAWLLITPSLCDIQIVIHFEHPLSVLKSEEKKIYKEKYIWMLMSDQPRQ